MKNQIYDIIIVGGGAAGFFTAINTARRNPNLKIAILEKTDKLLSKVKVSGGGRCNVTNHRSNPSDLTPFYPRGNKKLYSVFKSFTTSDMINWLKDHGVSTHVEEDLRVFPTTNSSQTIIDCFLRETSRLHITIEKNCGLTKLYQDNNFWILETKDQSFKASKVVMSTGASQQMWRLLTDIGLSISSPVPSLFTFKIDDERIKSLPGVSFAHSKVKITGSKLEETGPLLITHWGLSGPAILKLSAWGARELEANNYKFQIIVNFSDVYSFESFQSYIQQQKADAPKRKVSNYAPDGIPKRFWEQICTFCAIDSDEKFGDLSKKQINKLSEEMTQGIYQVSGKSTFKEEFVTCGGVKLSEVNLNTFEAKRFPNLYLAGEVIDIDALTGGFNFQACWSAGWIISQSIFQNSQL